MTQDQYNDLVNTVQQLTEKTDTLADSIARVDTKVENTKYVTRLLDVNVQYPAENDVLVYDKTGKWKNAQYDEIGLQPGEGGESNVYVIGIGDDTSPTNENVYSAARTIEDWVSSKNDDIVEGSLTFNKGKTIYIDNIRSRDASEGTDLGNGFICKIKSSGKSYIEVDDLAVRGAAMFNTLEIKKITSVGGNLIVSPASNNIIRVEETTQLYEDQYQSVYRCYFRNKDEKDGGDTEQIKTDFQVGDLAKIQQFNVAVGVNEGAKNRYYWGRVLGVGEDYIDLSKTDVDPSTNTQPAEGDALVQYGNRDNIKRQNVISITTYADNAPAIQMYQGLNSYSTDGKAIIEMAYDTAQTQQQAYMNVYGRMYVGSKDKSSYVQFDPTENSGRGKVTVKADIEIISGSGYNNLADKPDINGMISSANSESSNNFAKTLGYDSYTDMVDKARDLGTIISGGYIRTSLVHADQLITTDLLASTISSGGKDLNINGNFIVKPDGSFTCNRGTINQEVIINGNISGAQGTIGGFTINTNNLIATESDTSMTLSAEEIVFRNNNVGVIIGAHEYGAIQIMSYNFTNVDNLLYLSNNNKLAITVQGNSLFDGVMGYNAWYQTLVSGTSLNLPVNNVYVFPMFNYITDFYFPTIQQFLNAFSKSGFVSSLFTQPIMIPIYFLSDPQYPSQKEYKIHFGSGKQLTDRPIIIISDGGTGTEITMDHQSYAMYMLYIYDGTTSGNNYRGVLKQIHYTR